MPDYLRSFSPPFDSQEYKFEVFPELDSENIVPRLRAGGCPSTSEAITLLQVLAQAKAEVDRYDVEISRLQERRDILRTKIDMAQSLLSPIHKLPLEILSDIFCYHGNNKLGTSVLIPAAKFSSVCLKWYNATLVTPALFSCITITYSDAVNVWDLIVPTLEHLVRRSGHIPLDIDIIREKRLPDATQNDQAIAGVLSLHANHCKTLSLPTTIAEVMTQALPFKRWAILENLAVIGWGYYQDRGWNVLNIFQAAHKLRTVSLLGIDPDNIVIPWSQILHLRVEGLRSGQMAKAIALCPSLLTANFVDIVPTSHQHTQLFHSSMNALFIKSDTRMMENELSSLFQSLTLPSLSSITVASASKTRYGLVYWPCDSFSSLITRSSCTVTILRVEHVVISEMQLKALFQALPSLVALTMHEPERHMLDLNWERFDNSIHPPLITDNLLRLMHIHPSSTGPASSPLLLPCLQMLDFSVRGRHFTDQIFADMVKSRTGRAGPGLASLKSVSLDVMDRCISCDIIDSLSDLEEHGLIVKTRDEMDFCH